PVSVAEFLCQSQQTIALEHEFANHGDEFIQFADIDTHALGSRIRANRNLALRSGCDIDSWCQSGHLCCLRQTRFAAYVSCCRRGPVLDSLQFGQRQWAACDLPAVSAASMSSSTRSTSRRIRSRSSGFATPLTYARRLSRTRGGSRN